MEGSWCGAMGAVQQEQRGQRSRAISRAHWRRHLRLATYRYDVGGMASSSVTRAGDLVSEGKGVSGEVAPGPQ